MIGRGLGALRAALRAVGAFLGSVAGVLRLGAVTSALDGLASRIQLRHEEHAAEVARSAYADVEAARAGYRPPRQRSGARAEVERAGEAVTTEIERTKEQLETEAERQRGLAEVEVERSSSGEPAPRPPVARVRGAMRAELDRSRRLERQRERDRDRERER